MVKIRNIECLLHQSKESQLNQFYCLIALHKCFEERLLSYKKKLTLEEKHLLIPAQKKHCSNSVNIKSGAKKTGRCLIHIYYHYSLKFRDLRE